MKKILKSFILILILFIPSQKVLAQEVSIYLFYGNTCPICEKEREFLDKLKDKYNNIVLYEFETYKNKTNYQNMLKVKEMFSITTEGVPFTVIGDTAILGFTDAYKDRIENLVKRYTTEEYDDVTGVYLGYKEEKIEATKEVETTDLSDTQTDEKKPTLTTPVILIFSSFLVLIGVIIFILKRCKKR